MNANVPATATVELIDAGSSKKESTPWSAEKSVIASASEKNIAVMFRIGSSQHRSGWFHQVTRRFDEIGWLGA